MATDATQKGSMGGTAEVMASVERAGEETRFVIADISQDDAWVSADSKATPRLDAWR